MTQLRWYDGQGRMMVRVEGVPEGMANNKFAKKVGAAGWLASCHIMEFAQRRQPHCGLGWLKVAHTVGWFAQGAAALRH